MKAPVIDVEIRHAHLFCGIGGGAKGFNRASARVGNLRARFRCLGGIDHDAAALRDFKKVVGVPGALVDLFDRDQYVAFHGREPPAGWHEAAPGDIHRAFGHERPHIIFLSAPCKGFSGLLSERTSGSAKYQALNRLTLRGVWLALEAYKDDPVELFIFENVPRIATRGRHLLDQIVALFRAYGYAVAETTHDCGELGNLAQSRKRFLLVARHAAKVPNFLYQPTKHPLRGVGEVLDKLPVPGFSDLGGPMHRMPCLHWKTWVRLAFVRAGSDWRSLNDLRVEDGHLADYGIAADVGWHGNVLGVTGWDHPSGVITGDPRPTTGRFSVADPRAFADWNADVLGVRTWDETSGTVAGRSTPTNGAYAVADPRIDGHEKSVQMGVRRWDQPAGVVTSKMFAGGGPNSIADPRIAGRPRFNNVFRIVPWVQPAPAVAGPGGPAGGLAVADPRTNSKTGTHESKFAVQPWGGPSKTVTGSDRVGSGALCVADPRAPGPHQGRGKYIITAFDAPTNTVIASSMTGQGAFAVADPRARCLTPDRQAYVTGGHYGVVEWTEPSGAVSAHPKNNNGPWSVADPRATTSDASNEDEKVIALPGPSDRLVCVIRALDGTWHRPFTTLDLAALQSLIEPEEYLELDGLSDSAWRERIGNMVPPESAAAIGSVMGRALLGAWSGETFMLSSEPIWVQPIAVALCAAS